MRDRWRLRGQRAARTLHALVYRSRLIGDEGSLGLYGGGNTSLKCTEPDLAGRPQDVLWVKGSGCDLKGCETRHFTPLRLAALRPLVQRPRMTDAEMVRLLERCTLDPRAPRPSVETLLHAFIPEVAIDHTHADAILALANTEQGERLVRRVLGERVLWIPYIQPGFALSRRVWEAYQRDPTAEGAVLEKHGLLTWGPDGYTSYRRTIGFVTRGERFLARQRSHRWSSPAHEALPVDARTAVLRRLVPAIRRSISQTRKACLTAIEDPEILAFVNARRMPEVARVGPATPDHMLRTKRLPFILELRGRSVAQVAPADVQRQIERYARCHRTYVARFGGSEGIVDPYPRVLLLPGVGMLATGKDATETNRVTQIYRHAIRIMRGASSIGRYTSVSERQAYGVEYWPLELAKLASAQPEPELAREIGLVTGAAGGIGRAIAECLASRGASVAVTDVDRRAVEQIADQLNAQMGRQCALGIAMDVTREASIQRACDAVLRTFGGLDFLVSNAGVATVAAVDRLARAEWERSFLVNATGHFLVARAVIPWLRAQGLGGALIFIASKNVLAPGREFGAYSAAKAAETQLARVLAIENGEFGIRVNIVNPDGVFEGSGLWRSIRASRAKTYGLRPAQLETHYQQRNLLKTRVLPQDVAEAVCFLVSKRSAKTTGCIVTVDGGVREAFPR